MKWIDASKYWPGMHSRNFIIDGSAYLYLKPKYLMPGHTEQMMVEVNFYCLVRIPQPWDGNFDNQFSLESALIYEIESYCCDSEADKEEHDKYFRDIGCYAHNITKFIDKKEFTAPWDSINRWAYLEDNE